MGLDGAPVAVAVVYSVDDRPVGLIDSTGTFVANKEGEARITAAEPGGVVGRARVTVGPVTSLAPAHTSFGGVVTVEGAGFGPQSRIRFGAVSGRIRHASPDGRTLEAWVPWDAESGLATITLQDGREVVSPTPFFLTGGNDDALEPNDQANPVEIAVPFENPYLASRLTSLDHYTFTLFAPTPLSVRVSDRNELNTWPLRLTVQLNRTAGVQEFVGVAPVFAFDRNERQDGVIGRASLGPGTYALRVFVAPGSNVVDRRYEIHVDTVADYQLPPDEAEPDDAPPEAPLITTPFSGRFALENPWAVDYYALDLRERSRVFVEAAFPGGLGVFLIDGEQSVTWQVSNGVRSDTFHGSLGPFGFHAFDCTLEPGRYYVGVLDNSGSAGPYDLSIDVRPTQLTYLNCETLRPGAPSSDGFHARGAPR
jgi:hypothetical protein